MTLGAGVRIGPYEIVSAIGAGGMGEVYRARDTRLQRDVALKLLPAGVSSDPDRMARFEQEARAAAALNHSNTLAVYVKLAGGATPEELLLKSGGSKAPRSWSADGRFIVYDGADAPTTQSDIWVLPLTGDRKPFPFLMTPAREGQGTLSPDGKWMAYTSNESGRYDIYVQPFPPTGGKWLVSTGGGAVSYTHLTLPTNREV